MKRKWAYFLGCLLRRCRVTLDRLPTSIWEGGSSAKPRSRAMVLSPARQGCVRDAVENVLIIDLFVRRRRKKNNTSVLIKLALSQVTPIYKLLWNHENKSDSSLAFLIPWWIVLTLFIWFVSSFSSNIVHHLLKIILVVSLSRTGSKLKCASKFDVSNMHHETWVRLHWSQSVQMLQTRALLFRSLPCSVPSPLKLM